MTDFYTPNLLFRQNAMRVSPRGSPNPSLENLTCTNVSIDSLPRPAPWFTTPEIEKDTELMTKSCSLNRLNIKSNYWKIPDDHMNLTAMDVKKGTSTGDHDPILAILLAQKQANLFIYLLNLDNNYLTHNNTISLPNIHDMKWTPDAQQLNLATGNSGGSAHLISVPEPDSIYENAEIVKKFNHKKYLKPHTPANVSKLDFLTANELVTLYQGNLFRWDVSSTKSKPLKISTVKGIRNFDVIPSNSATLAISGDFGVSLFDTRESSFKVPSYVNSAYRTDYKKVGSNIIKWSHQDPNIFAASHFDGVVRLWDIRMQEFFGQLDGHHGKLATSLEWNGQDLFSGAKDGNIVHWDLTDTTDSLLNCTLKEGLDSVNFNGTKNTMELRVDQRQCGTILPASNTNIISMAPIDDDGDCKVLSIDGSSFLGVHTKIYDAINVNINNEKLYYTSSDISLLLQSEASSGKTSNDTLVAEDDQNDVTSLQLTKPLNIGQISMDSVKVLMQYVNDVKHTLLDEPVSMSRTPTTKSLCTEDELDFNLHKELELGLLVEEFGGFSPNFAADFSDNDSLSTNPTICEEEISESHKITPSDLEVLAPTHYSMLI